MGRLLPFVLVLGGCGLELGDEQCRCIDEPPLPAHCAVYVDACHDAAMRAFIVDVPRLGPELAREVYALNLATCERGVDVCVAAVDAQNAPDGGPGGGR